MRNKYLNLQREMVREMKKEAYFRRMQMGHQHNPAARTATAATGTEEGNDVEGVKSKRRKRGREKVKEAIKKNSHVFFEA